MSYSFKRFLAWVGLIVFGVNSLTILANPSTWKATDSLPGMLVLIAVFLWIAYKCVVFLSHGRLKFGENRDKLVDRLTKEALEWSDGVQSGRYPPIDNPGVITQPGESAWLAENTQLSEVVTRRKSGYVGSRITIGKVPLYFGGSESTSWKEMQASDAGRLVLTNRNLVFVGSLRTIKTSLKKIAHVAPSLDAITISIESRNGPVVFHVRNPILWAAAIQEFSAAAE